MGNRLILVLHWLFSITAVLLIGFAVLVFRQGETVPNPNYNVGACKGVEGPIGTDSSGLIFCAKTSCEGCPSRDERINAELAFVGGLATIPVFAVIMFIIYGRWIWFPWQHDD